jgi:hypothetical protein
MTREQPAGSVNLETPATEEIKVAKRSTLNAHIAKWACAFPTVAALFALITEHAFFGRSAIWEVLRGTGEGG